MDSILIWVSRYGYAGLFFLLVLGIVGLPVPDETLLVFSGYLISTGRFHPVLAFASGFCGSASGISISYFIGKTFGHSFVERYGRYIHLSPKRVNDVNRWFHQVGHWLLTIGYYIPGVRHFTALVAGMSNLEYRVFAAYAYPGAAIWVGSFLALGYFVGENWRATLIAVHKYVLIVIIIAFVLAAVFWVLRERRRRAV
ncbi:MAG: DedA family protein [Acidobacteriaceae bacterium]|nr:DedA family protein [Acidobacteriaceae bacterium]MBV9781073.1 DedA family protein [Acidobacteriaceae bacterium]